MAGPGIKLSLFTLFTPHVQFDLVVHLLLWHVLLLVMEAKYDKVMPSSL